MALLKAYSTNRNNSFPSTADEAHTMGSWAWLFKSLLLNSGTGINAFDSTWTDGLSHTIPTVTVAGSSDSVTAGMDGVDRWTTTYNSSKLVSAANGTAHSWIVLAFPSGIASLHGGKGPAYLCIDMNNGESNVGGDHCVVMLSFAGFTGGSITNRPASTDGVFMKADSGGSIKAFDGGISTNARVMNLSFGQDGTFFMFTAVTGSSHAEHSTVMFESTQTRTGHSKPLILGCNETDHQTGNSPWIAGYNGFTGGHGYFDGSQFTMAGFNSNASQQLGFSALAYNLDANGQIFASAGTGGFASVDMEDGAYDLLPIILAGFNGADNQRTMVTAADWMWGPWITNTNPLAQGTTISAAGQIQQVLIGSTFLPCSGAVTF